MREKKSTNLARREDRKPMMCIERGVKLLERCETGKKWGQKKKQQIMCTNKKLGEKEV